MNEKSLFERAGGRPTLDKVHKVFYDKMYEHPWMKLFFTEVKQEIIEEQQSDFMTKLFGGGDIYLGKLPKPAHKHMYLTQEHFDVRHQLLSEALIESGVPEDIREEWLKIDEAFKAAILKKSVDECEKRFNTDELQIIPNPNGKKAA